MAAPRYTAPAPSRGRIPAVRAGGYLHVDVPEDCPRLLREAIRNLGRPDPASPGTVLVPAFHQQGLVRLADRYGRELDVREVEGPVPGEAGRQVRVLMDGGRTIFEHPEGAERPLPPKATEALRGNAFRVLPGRWLAMSHQAAVLVARLQKAGFEVLAPPKPGDESDALPEGVRRLPGHGVTVTFEPDPATKASARREAPVFMRVDWTPETGWIARRVFREARRRGHVRLHARGYGRLWMAPDRDRFEALRQLGERRGFAFRRGILQGRPLAGVSVYADVGCLPARFLVTRPKPQNGEEPMLRPEEEAAERLLRETEGVEADDERGHLLVPSTRAIGLVAQLRELGARVLLRRLAPKRMTLRDWKEDLPVDHTGARPAPRRWAPRRHDGPYPGLREGVVLDPHQEEMVAFIRDTGFLAYVGDEMGLGKTLSVIAACLTTPERVLVVCPPSARYDVWQREIERWTHEGVRVIAPGTDPEKAVEEDGGEKFVVLGYHGLEKFMPALSRLDFGVAVLDEAHYTRNKRARRTALAHAWLRGYPKRVLMSGSPVMNEPEEIRKQLEFIRPDEWSDERWFRERFLEPWRNGTPSVQEAVLAKLSTYFEGVMLRREKRHVLPDLPEKKFRVHREPLDRAARDAYELAEAAFAEYVDEHEDEALGRGLAGTAAKLETLKQTALVGKLPRALQLMEALLEAGEKLVVFTKYVDVVKSVGRELARYGAVTYYGATRPEERTKAVEAFTTDPDTRVFVGQLIAAGTAITLTSARHVLFLDLDWNPENHRQAMDRVHRKGQTRDVTVHFVLAEDTVDDDIAHTLERKAHMTSYLLDRRASGLGLTPAEAPAASELKRDVALGVLRRTRRAMAATGDD